MSDRRYKRLLRLSRAVLEHAENGDWEAVTDLERERHPLVSEFFSSECPAHERESRRNLIQTLLEIDRQIVRLVEARREEIAHQLQTITRGRGAMRAYALNSR